MAAAASGHPAEYCLSEMSAAEALQYQALYLEMEGNITAPLDKPPTEERL